MTPCSDIDVDVSEEHITSIFRIVEYEDSTFLPPVNATRLHGVTSQAIVIFRSQFREHLKSLELCLMIKLVGPVMCTVVSPLQFT
jgi:hypothetical protein